MAQTQLIQIDLDQVLSQKLGKKKRYVPKAMIEWLKRTVRQDELNEKLRLYYPKTDAEFCKAVREDFDIDIDVKNAQSLPAADDCRVIFACNHPLGGMDGILLISELTRRYGPNVKVVVNDILMAVQPLSGVFLPINKHGRQSRESISDINAAMDGDAPILVFPAGLVSRRGSDGQIRDLQWHKMFVAKARQYHRDVVPLHFDGRNSDRFYRWAQWRKRLGIKFNLEMVLLPSEALDCKGKRFTLSVGQRIPWNSLDGENALQSAEAVKKIVYSLANQNTQI